MPQGIDRNYAIAKQNADRLKTLIATRLNCSPGNVKCSRAKSEMTLCIARDGGLAVCEDAHGAHLCVGCGRGVAALLEKETARHAT